MISKIFKKNPCPYCKKELEKRPSRKKECPYCGKFIFVRTRPSDRKQVLVTQEEKDKIDAEWREINGTAEAYEEEQKAFSEMKEKLRKGFNREPLERDVIWAVFNKSADSAMKRQDLGALQTIYSDMAFFLKEEGKDNFHLLQQSQKMSLLALKRESSDIIEGVEVLAAIPDSCPACTKLHGRVYTIDQAIKEMPIPNKNCTHKKGCRCTYIPALKEL